MNCLYKFCNSDHDGFLSETNVVNLLAMFAMSGVESNKREEETKEVLDEIKTIVIKVFIGKRQVSEQEFYQSCTENEDFKTLNEMVRGRVGVFLIYGLEFFK
jgi:hypothetical protein